MDTPPPEEPQKPGLVMPIVWVLIALLGTGAAVAGVGIGVMDSESAGMMAAQIAAGPLGFVLAGALGGLIIHFAVKRATTLLRVVGPMGCGCLGGGVAAGLTVLFFTLIFPSL